LPSQKFTGQRLDGTGLYYYGARYYDPTIGRLISPDTLVPSPANPQSLNRYSYCLNNPLKYVDPSGHVVEFQNEWWVRYCALNGYTSGDGWNAVAQPYVELNTAWSELSNVAPDLTNALENDPTVITIQWKDLGWSTTGYTAGQTSNNQMYFNSNSHISWNLRSLASTMGHESFHQLMDLNGFTADSAYEEACAFSYGSAIDKTLNGVMTGWWDRGLNPHDNMKINSSYEWVKNYVNKDIWQTYGDHALWDWNMYEGKWENYHDFPKEGGYQAMVSLFVQYYPK
jgi:RHS repeat-associated protein